MTKFTSLFLSLAFIASCSSRTLITSSDPASKIYVDGEYRGVGAVAHEDTKIVGSTTQVTIKKDGCAPQNFVFTRSEEFSPGACAGGVFVLVPFLWVMGYKPSRTYEYQCEKM